MRDAGLDEAITGGRRRGRACPKIGISQPSVSNWSRVPAERVLAVEAVTGVSRAVLRPDLYDEQPAADVDEVDAARAQEYALLATLLARAPDAGAARRGSRGLRGDASPLGLAHAALAEAAAATDAEQVEREYFDLFIGLGRGELLPYGSYYLTGFLHERPLARLREDLGALGIERAEGNAEPEDHAAILCEIMAGLAAAASRRRRAPTRAVREASGALDRPLLRRSGARRGGGFLPPVGTLGRVFMEIETEAFALPS